MTRLPFRVCDSTLLPPTQTRCTCFPGVRVALRTGPSPASIPFGGDEGNTQQQHSKDLCVEEGGHRGPLQTHRAVSLPAGRAPQLLSCRGTEGEQRSQSARGHGTTGPAAAQQQRRPKALADLRRLGEGSRQPAGAALALLDGARAPVCKSSAGAGRAAADARSTPGPARPPELKAFARPLLRLMETANPGRLKTLSLTRPGSGTTRGRESGPRPKASLN